MVHDLPGDFGVIVDVNILVADNDEFGKHEHSRTPDRVDHLLSMAGIPFLDPDDHIVMEHAFNGHVHVEDIWSDHLEKREKYPLRGLTEIGVFLRRASDQRSRIDGILPVSDCGNMEYRV